jgi:signal transduction histidine kinase
MGDAAAGKAIYAEQLGMVFRQQPIVLAVNVINASLTAYVLFDIVPQAPLSAWLASVVLLSAARLVLFYRHRRSRERSERENRRWAALAAAGSMLSGALWGFGAILLFPESVIHRMFLMLVVAGMCAGGSATLAAHLPSSLGFLLLATLPLAVRLALEGLLLDFILAAMTLVFAVALSLVSISLNRSIATTLSLRVDLQAQTAALDAASTRLQEEMADHRATEATLRQAQKMEAVGQLTAGIAHDFNNLLTAVIGNLELAVARGVENARTAPLLEGALHAAERGADLTQRLLAFGRKQRLDPKPVDVVLLLDRIEELLRRSLGPTIAIATSGDAGLPPARADPQQLELAILNLALNARDAMPSGGELRIDVTARNVTADGGNAPPELTPGEHVVVAVGDTGEGMDQATLERAFEPFFTTKGIGEGTGLGLSMVHGFAAQSGGAIRLRSRKNVGTIAEIWLPRAEAMTEAAPALSATQIRDGKDATFAAFSVLVCDDDGDVRQFVGEMLRAHGCTVHEAEDAAAALRLLDGALRIDAMVADYAMPGLFGDALVEEARRRRPGIKAVIISGYAETLPADRLAGVHVLRKPFRAAELLGLLEEA